MSEFKPGEYRVDFERIGRKRGVPPLFTNVKTADDLADRIERCARRYLASRGIEVNVLADGTGRIYAGDRPAGTFTWALVD